MSNNITNEDYRARYQAIQAIEDACIRSEKGEKIDLRDTAKKISELMQQLNKDAKAIHGKTGVSVDVRKAHDHCMKNLTSLDARVKALSARVKALSVGGSKFSTRMNSICNVALIVAGIGAMIAIGNKAFSATPLASEKSPITNVILPKMTADHLALYAKWATLDDGHWMRNLEDLWQLNGGEGFFSKDDQSFIRNAYHLARKEMPASERLLMNAVVSLDPPPPQEELAKLGDSFSMRVLEYSWQSGTRFMSEEGKSAIRSTYKLAIEKLIMDSAFSGSRSFEERAKNGDRMSMYYLNDLWQSQGAHILETDLSSIENAYDLARYGKEAVIGHSDAMYFLETRWRKDSSGSIPESYKDLIRDGYHAEVEMRQKEYEEFVVHNKRSDYWMNLLKALWRTQGADWQGRGTCVSEDHKSSIIKAFNLANNIKGCD